jgi:hypothetical protein
VQRIMVGVMADGWHYGRARLTLVTVIVLTLLLWCSQERSVLPIPDWKRVLDTEWRNGVDR